MKTMKTILAASTAIALAGAAWADENEAYLLQNGNDNDAPIAQSGEGNVAGRFDRPMEQDGDDNKLDVLQSGDDNFIGANSAGNGYFLQSEDENSASIEQASDGNVVERVDQVNDASSGVGNSLKVRQEDGDDNTIFTVLQTRKDGGSGKGNKAELTQTGNDNLVRIVNQNGDDNRLFVDMSGDGNGRPLLTGAADVAGDGSFRQSGLDNFIRVDISGNDTGIGVQQRGDGNSVGTLTINGDSNEIGIAQGGTTSGESGDDNTVALGVIDGFSNIIGITQLNDDNRASVNIIDDSDDNIVDILQEDAFGSGGDATVNIEGNSNGGDENEVKITQQAAGFADVGVNGDRNDVQVTQFNSDRATVRIDGRFDAGSEGDDNHLFIKQGLSNSANPNVAKVTIVGDDNNTGSFSSGALAMAALADVDAYHTSGTGLQPGELGQKGKGNKMTLTVGEFDVAEATGNLFAATQFGDDNTLNGTIKGDDNEAVFSQSGTDNKVTFVQNTNNNLAAAIQDGTGNTANITQ